MKLTDLSVNRSVTAAMLFLAVIIFGIVSFSKTPVDMLPNLEFPIAAIITEYKGAGPQEVESVVTRPLEENVTTVNNIESVTSTSKEGVSMVIVKFNWGTGMDGAIADIREKIDIMKGYMPDGVSTPIVFKFDVSMMPIMYLSVVGDRDSAYLRQYSEDILKNQLEQVDGIASVIVIGGEEKEIKVQLSKNRLDAYGLTADYVINVLRAENMNIAAGKINTATKKYTIRTKGEFQTINDIKNTVVTVKNFTPVYLKDVGDIYEAPAERTEITRLDGKPGVLLMLRKQSDKNTVLTARNVKNKLEEINKNLPNGMKLKTVFSSADYIENSINNLISSGIIGGLIAILVVFIFLRNIRSSLILGLSIPISIITTFVVMYFSGITLNIMSMGGLAIGVGMLIDNSIVVLDNIFRYRENGARPSEAAKLGADEMAMAIAASTLTTIVVFVPFLFSEGFASKLFREMALTITISLLSSLVVALTLIPMLSAKFIKTVHPHYDGMLSFVNGIQEKSENIFQKIENYYGKSIHWVLKNRLKTIGLTIASFIFGILMIALSGFEFMPEQDQAQISFTAALPTGTNLETTDETMKEIERRVKKIVRPEEYIDIYANAGTGSGVNAGFSDTNDHTARIEIWLVPSTKRKRSQNEIKDIVRKELKNMPGVTFNFNADEGQGGGLMGSGSQIAIEIYGYELEKGENYAKEIFNACENIPGLKDMKISREEGLPEKIITINRDKASKLGLSASSIANTINNSVAGKVASRFRKDGKEYDVFVQLQESDRENIEDLKSLQIATPFNTSVPAGNIIDITTSQGPAAIERKNQERVIYIKCKAEGSALKTVVTDIEKKIKTIPRPANFHVEIGGSVKDMNETYRDLALALVLAILLIYIIMAAQFESFLSPFIVMLSVPTLVFGSSIFLFMTGTHFSVIAFMGIIMLGGIVVNNAIVLIDYTNILRARGATVHDALIEAGTKRLRPILMTTFTTIFGLIPMALGIGDGAELTAPLARTVMGGMSSSFIFTLLFIPVMYSVFYSRKDKNIQTTTLSVKEKK